MKRFLLFGMVLLGLVSCQEEPLEEFIQEDPDIMIYWWATASLNGPENNTIDWLIGSSPRGGATYNNITVILL